MLELGIIRQSTNGLYHLLPLAQRSLDKLISIINKNMMDIGAQKISMPVLIHSNLWKKTGLSTHSFLRIWTETPINISYIILAD